MVLWTALPIHDNVGCKIMIYYLLTLCMLLAVHVFTCVDFPVQCSLSYHLVWVGATYALLPRLLFFYTWVLLTHCALSFLLLWMGATYVLCFTQCTLRFYPQCSFCSILAVTFFKLYYAISGCYLNTSLDWNYSLVRVGATYALRFKKTSDMSECYLRTTFYAVHLPLLSAMLAPS